MKQAKIKCPHCGKPIIVREIEPHPEVAAAMKEAWKYFDKAFEYFDKAFDRLSKK